MIASIATVAKAIGSLRLTLTCVALAAAFGAVGDGMGLPVGRLMAVPLAVLFVNLVAAVAVNQKLRTNGGLLGFHLALALVAMLAAFDRLASLEGHVEVTEGAAFDPDLVEGDAGPLHRWNLHKVRFVQGGFSIRYEPRMKRRDTASTVFVPSGSQGWKRLVVGDENPLVVDGYRFYTSFNKGFAPVLTFVDGVGEAKTGAVHLPSYPLNYFKQGNTWTAPGDSKPIKLWLHIPEPVYVADASWKFAKPADATLVVMAEGTRHELVPGQSIALHGGALRFEEIRSWMGYTISYNPTLSWILAAAMIAILCLGWHVVAKIMRRPWDAQFAGSEVSDDR